MASFSPADRDARDIGRRATGIAARVRRAVRPGIQALVIAGLLSGCDPDGNLPVFQGSATAPYTLGPGDRLRVIVYGEKQLTGTFRVSDQGDISVPLLGRIPASGRTSTELGEEIAGQLRRNKMILNPSVSVDVEQYRPIYLLGEVEHPGAYPYEPGLTMLSAVALAGGFTYRGVTSSAKVVRTRSGHAVEGIIKPASFLQPGDVVTISERFF